MYKLMIVDDEPAIRKGLVNFVDWNAVDCEAVSEAANGLDAIEKMKDILPDILICDVKMPGMNGIELAKFVYENYPETKVIILTGYADFTNAQTALKYGVVDFVLKPTEIEQLSEAVSKAKKIITQQRQSVSRFLALEGKISKNICELKEKLIHDIIDGVVNKTSIIEEKCTELGISLNGYHVMFFDIENDMRKTASSSSEEDEQFISRVKNFLSLAFKDFEHIIVPVKRNCVISLISFGQPSPDECKRIILDISGEILGIVEGLMGFSLSIGVSNIHTGLIELYEAYDEAAKALEVKFYNDISSISFFSEYSNNLSIEEKVITNTFIENILTSVKEGNKDTCLSMIKEMLEKLRLSKQPIDYIKNICLHLCSSFETLIHCYDMDTSDNIQKEYNVYKDILECQSIHHLFDILANLVGKISTQLNSLENQSNSIIEKTIAYLNENYRSDFSLKALAYHVHINSSYLSRLFKKETGDTITDAIKKIRLEKAKKLLQNTDMKTYEVASAVGINDPAYFSVIFKKHTGMSPKDYKYISPVERNNISLE